MNVIGFVVDLALRLTFKIIALYTISIGLCAYRGTINPVYLSVLFLLALLIKWNQQNGHCESLCSVFILSRWMYHRGSWVLLFHHSYFPLPFAIKGETVRTERNSRSSHRQTHYSSSVITNEMWNMTPASSCNLQRKLLTWSKWHDVIPHHAKHIIKIYCIFSHQLQCKSGALSFVLCLTGMNRGI